MSKKRIVYLDVLRVVACLSVIMIHSSAGYVIINIGSFDFFVGNIFDSISRIGVPLFVMISGALMLDRNYVFSQNKLIKHIIKMLVFFVFWSILYSIIYKILIPIFIKNESVDIIKVVEYFVEGHYHLWYVYLIIGLYLILPLLRLWVNDNNKKYVEYFIILSLIFTYLIPQIVNIGCNYNTHFEIISDIIEKKLQLKYIGGYSTYFILGWYIHNYEIKNKRSIYILGIIGLILTFLGTYILSITTGKAIQMYGNLTINVFFQAVAMFVYIKDTFMNWKGNDIINNISKYSLGIYAVHAVYVSIISEVLTIINYNFALINIFIVFIISFILSYFSTLILSKIPIIKNVV